MHAGFAHRFLCALASLRPCVYAVGHDPQIPVGVTIVDSAHKRAAVDEAESAASDPCKSASEEDRF